jgi:Protein of unknown function (DUF3105)
VTPATRQSARARGGSRGPGGSRLVRAVEWTAIAIASLVLSIGLILLLSGYFAGRDQAAVSGGTTGPGQSFPDLGHATLAPGQAGPSYNSSPPTSGAHVPEAVVHDDATLNSDQLLQALQLGDVVIAYGARQPPAGLAKFARSVAPAFTPALAATGDAVILARRPGTDGLVALAWTHLLRVGSASDPQLGQFVSFWLGRGAPGQ